MGENTCNSLKMLDFVAVVTVNLDAAHYYVRNTCRISNVLFQPVLSVVKIDRISNKSDLCHASTKGSYIYHYVLYSMQLFFKGWLP